MEEGSVAWMGKPHPDISGSEINWFCLRALPSDQLGPSRTCCLEKLQSREGRQEGCPHPRPPAWAPWVDNSSLKWVPGLQVAKHIVARVKGRGRLLPCLSFVPIKGVKTPGEEEQIV